MNMQRLLTSALFGISAVASSSTVTHAQCAEWSPAFHNVGFDGPVYAFAVFDDGSGPALYAGGDFQHVDGVLVNYLAKWDGSKWSALAGGLETRVFALTVFDDGSGPALFAGGAFNYTDSGQLLGRVGKWNGSSWSIPGTGVFGNGWVHALCVADVGSGPELYAGGEFIATAGPTAAYIAKWEGPDWVPLGSGTNHYVLALASYDDGSGEKLYAAGQFNVAGGVTANRIAAWNGTDWSALDTGLNGGLGSLEKVHALAVFDDGSGLALFAAGEEFETAGGTSANNIAKWNGTAWSALGTGIVGHVEALISFDDGNGPALYAGGNFSTAGGVSVNRVASWNGSSWSALDSVFDSATVVYALGEFDDGSGTGPLLHAVNQRWDGDAWTSIPSYGAGVSATILCMTAGDVGSGPSVFAAGDFASAGPVSCTRIARWDGSHWWSLGDGLNDTVNAVCVYDDGSGPALYAGGEFTIAGGVGAAHIAKWNGSSWSALDAGVDGIVYSLSTYDDGTGAALYAGGAFTTAGASGANRIAKWNGTSWSALGTGANNWVLALTVYDDGAGPDLYAAGIFSTAGGSGTSRIARWNGTSWSSVSGGANNTIRAVTAFDDGTGAALYAGGDFTSAGGTSASHVAKWNGTSWSALDAGVDNTVRTMTSFDDGSGPRLFAGGSFIVAGGVIANRVAQWSGSAWLPLDTGVATGNAFAMQVFDEGVGAGPELYVGGSFTTASGIDSQKIARWGTCQPGATFCFGDDVDPFVTTDCPCANFGSSGHGCANSNPALGGAQLTAVGTTSPNTVLFTCTGIPNNALATFWRGTLNTPAGGVVHDGIQCLGGTTIRFGQQFAGQLGNPAFTVSVGATALPPGSTRYYQVLYRNPAPGFCPPGTYNFSSGYKITW